MTMRSSGLTIGPCRTRECAGERCRTRKLDADNPLIHAELVHARAVRQGVQNWLICARAGDPWDGESG
jgi:hypothetical protein